MDGDTSLHIDCFDYKLPLEYIAQEPLEPRDSAKMLIYDKMSDKIAHRHIRDIVQYINKDDVLVINDSRVIHAKLSGVKTTGGHVEILLLRQMDELIWYGLCRGAKLRVGTELNIVGGDVGCSVVGIIGNGVYELRFWFDIVEQLEVIGDIPLPPYIKKELMDYSRYQTVYAADRGSVAAPTAGLHFTDELLNDIRDKGIDIVPVTLHVGLDTFRPVKVDRIEKHEMHSEWCDLDEYSVDIINKGLSRGGRIIAIGTTTVRVLETAATVGYKGRLKPYKGFTDLFIYPGYEYRVVNSLLTNFHLPRSTLLMMISAYFGEQGTDILMKLYQEAKNYGYRFYSFGDAMLIL